MKSAEVYLVLQRIKANKMNVGIIEQMNKNLKLVAEAPFTHTTPLHDIQCQSHTSTNKTSPNFEGIAHIHIQERRLQNRKLHVHKDNDQVTW